MSRSIAMIPARLGSQRLKKKNLELFGDHTLIEHAILKCKQSEVFDEIYVNSESEVFEKYAKLHNVSFYKRPEILGNNISTSEDFVEDFLRNVECDYLYQVHSITPLLSVMEIQEFVEFCNRNRQYDTVLSCIEDQIEVAYLNTPVNFSFSNKTNSQDLKPTQRITWSITKWSSKKYLNEKDQLHNGTYSGKIGFKSIGPYSGLAIKTEEDLQVARILKGISSDS